MPKQYIPLLGQPIALYRYLFFFVLHFYVLGYILILGIYQLLHSVQNEWGQRNCCCLWSLLQRRLSRYFLSAYVSASFRVPTISNAYFVSDAKDNIDVRLKFTLPGKERQDSVYSGLQVLSFSQNHSFFLLCFRCFSFSHPSKWFVLYFRRLTLTLTLFASMILQDLS